MYNIYKETVVVMNRLLRGFVFFVKLNANAYTFFLLLK